MPKLKFLIVFLKISPLSLSETKHLFLDKLKLNVHKLSTHTNPNNHGQRNGNPGLHHLHDGRWDFHQHAERLFEATHQLCSFTTLRHPFHQQQR